MSYRLQTKIVVRGCAFVAYILWAVAASYSSWANASSRMASVTKGTALPPGHAAKTVSERELAWINAVTARYLDDKGSLPPYPSDSDPKLIVLRIKQLYSVQAPGSTRATALAFWGAMNLAQSDEWIDRMLLSAQIEHMRHDRNDSVVLNLPEALNALYEKRRCEKAISALITLHWDGGYQENLDSIRLSMFLKYPLEFAHVLRAKSVEQIRRESTSPATMNFTYIFAYRLSDDKKLRHDFRTIQKAYSKIDTLDARFLHQYLTLTFTLKAPK